MDLLKLSIRNMVSRRSQMVVKSELEKLGINYINVGLGEVDILGKISKVNCTNCLLDLN